MMNSVASKKGYFAPAVAALAILGPMLIVILAGTLPISAPGAFVVKSHMFLVAVLAAALVLRAVYELGYTRARRLLATSVRQPLTAQA